MSTNLPEIIDDPNLSHAWARAFQHVLKRSQQHLAPLVLSVNQFDNNGLPVEDLVIRKQLDTILATKHKTYSTKISAATIFPYNAWLRKGRPSIESFSNWYIDNILPRLKARDPHHNNRGTYFERMIRFQGSDWVNGENTLSYKNQLGHIIQMWKDRFNKDGSRPRRSALQVSIFDPVKDHTGSALLGFPCLQQVSFTYGDSSSNTLALNAYYPTQYIMDRAYGNYLGLCHLGYFVARELRLKFVRFNCFIGLPEIGGQWTKAELRSLESVILGRLPNLSSSNTL
jgi:hypothetical protein